MSKLKKARRVDFSADEYIAGVAGRLTAVQQGVYWMACARIYSAGADLDDNDETVEMLAHDCMLRQPQLRRILDVLVEKKKLHRNDGKLSNKRSRVELERSDKRIQAAHENGSKGGRPPKNPEEKQDDEKAAGSFDEKLTNNYQLPTTNQQRTEASPQGDSVPYSTCPPGWDAEVHRNADRLVSVFDACINQVWGESQQRLCRAAVDLSRARDLVEAGVTDDFASAYWTGRMTNAKAAGKRPPVSLAFMGPDTIEAFQSQKNRPAGASGAATTSEKPFDPSTITERHWWLMVKRYREDGIWTRGAGLPPDTEGTFVPKAIRLEFGYLKH